jgi:hypothetical protein
VALCTCFSSKHHTFKFFLAQMYGTRLWHSATSYAIPDGQLSQIYTPSPMTTLAFCVLPRILEKIPVAFVNLQVYLASHDTLSLTNLCALCLLLDGVCSGGNWGVCVCVCVCVCCGYIGACTCKTHCPFYLNSVL